MKRLILLLLTPVLVLVPLLAICRYLWAVLTNPDRAWKIVVGYDQLMNVAANGSEDETISSRANRARNEHRQWGCILCKMLDEFDKNHCNNSAGQ